MKRIVRLLGLSGMAVGLIWYVRARDRMRLTGETPRVALEHDLRGFVTHRLDPLVTRFGLAGGRVSPWALLEHIGRTSGTVYRTPVYASLSGDHAFIPLPYGMDVHWVRNIQAAGHCRVQVHETIIELDEPRVVTPDENPLLPASLRRALDRTGAMYLRLHVLDRAPGTFARRWPEQATEPTLPETPAIDMTHPTEASPTEPATV